MTVGDFVAPGNEWVLGGGHLARTRNGYSFITPYLQYDPKRLALTGLLATKPYRERGASRQVIVPEPPESPRVVTRGPGE